MGRIPEEDWGWLWGYREWLIGIVRCDYKDMLDADENKICDLADDVLFRAAQKIEQLRDRRKLRPWLRTILKNAAADLWSDKQKQGETFAQWISAVNENHKPEGEYRYYAFLTLLELRATKGENRYIGVFKKNASARKVVNIPKDRAVQLLKKRFHSAGKDDEAALANLAQSEFQGMLDVSAFAKQITANIAAIFKTRIRSVSVPDDVIWEWCCALVIAEMRAGLGELIDETKTDTPANKEAARVSDEIFQFVLKTVLIEAAASTPPR